MNHKKLVIPVFCMLVVSFISLCIASYAWFSMGGQAEADSPEFKASAPENIQISKDNGKTWDSVVNVNLGNKEDLMLMPASTYTGINNNIFYTENVNDGASDNNTIFKVANTSVGEGIVGYYCDIDLWIRTTGNEDVKVALDVDDTNATKVIDLDGGNIAHAVRIAFLNPDCTDNSLNSTQSGNDVEPFVYSANAEFATNGKVINNIDEDGKGTKVSPQYLANHTQILKLSGSNDSGTHFVVRIWLEGEDPECVFVNGGKSFSVSLKFISMGK